MTQLTQSGLNAEAQAAKLADPSTDLKIKLNITQEIKDTLEIPRDPELLKTLAIVIPVLIDILKNGNPVFKKHPPESPNLEQQLRKQSLEILNKFGSTELIKPHASMLFQLLIQLIRRDNEEIGLLASKTYMELYRAGRYVSEASVPLYIQLFLDIYAGSEQVVATLFSPDSPVMKEPKPEKSEIITYTKAMESLKLIAELPTSIIFVYQSLQQGTTSVPPLMTVVSAVAKFMCLVTEPEKLALMEAPNDEPPLGTPESIIQKNVFADLVLAQAKSANFVAFFGKAQNSVISGEQNSQFRDEIVAGIVRLLRVLAPENYSTRKDILTAMRHLFTTDVKFAALPYLPSLLNERLLFGAMRHDSTLFILGWSAIADLVHHTRPKIPTEVLFSVLYKSSEIVSDTSLSHSMHTLACKVMAGIIEFLHTLKQSSDASPSKPEIIQQANLILHAILEVLAGRLAASAEIVKNVLSLQEGNPSDELKQRIELERTRTLPLVAYLATDNLDLVITDERLLVRFAIHTIKMAMNLIRALDGRVPDADLMGRIFESICRVTILYKGDPQEVVVIGACKDMLTEMEPHVFQEVWTTKMDFFFNGVLNYSPLLALLTGLLTQSATAQSLTAMLLRYLVDRLEILCDEDPNPAAVVIRMFRLAFSAITTSAENNERVLSQHFNRLLADSFSMAARSHTPRNVFLVIHTLFRCVGSKSSPRIFDHLHKEIIPMLPELLDNINKALDATDDRILKELLVEIALVTPARLQHLAPHLAFLFRPLAIALTGNSDLVKQGMRTIELCIDNLNYDFADPEGAPVSREIVDALHSVLKPGAANAEIAAAACRILGKIGGKNRRILHVPMQLSYEPSVSKFTIPVVFSTHEATLQVAPACAVAAKVLGDEKATDYHHAAMQLLRTQVFYLLKSEMSTQAAEELFGTIIDGLIEGIRLPVVEPQANQLLRDISRYLFDLECRRDPGMLGKKKLPLSYPTVYMIDSLPSLLARKRDSDPAAGRRLVANIIQELHDRGKEAEPKLERDITSLLCQITLKFASACWDENWDRKISGCAGISLMISDDINIGQLWPYEREIEICRALIAILRDMPPEPPLEVPDVTGTLLQLIRFCNTPKLESMDVDITFVTGSKLDLSSDEINHLDWPRRPLSIKSKFYVGFLATEVTNANKIVREAAMSVFGLVSELSGIKLSDLLKPALLERVVPNIYGKPLRMFAPTTQIGLMSGMTYILSLEPPVVEAKDELWRLIVEVIGIAEADDIQHLANKFIRRATQIMAQTKTAALCLITASLPMMDWFSKNHPVRTRATALLFRCLYIPNTEIKTAAYEGLKVLLANQSRLPKEHLQAGLRPVLMNLADPMKLTVAGLEGLARLLGLLTNYFKVEIATKLIDHFRALASEDALREAAYGPIADNETISKLVRLLDIFHLLPAAANNYLEQVTMLVVTTETQLHAASPTAFTAPLSTFMDRFPQDTSQLVFRHIRETRFMQTIRHIVQGKGAPNFVKDLKTRGADIAQALKEAESGYARLPALMLCLDLAKQDPVWVSTQEEILAILNVFWTDQFAGPVNEISFAAPRLILIRAIYTIWILAFKVTPRVDFLFSMALIFTQTLQLDVSDLLDFVFQHVNTSTSIEFKQELVRHFIGRLDDPSCGVAHLTQYLRVFILPVLNALYLQVESPGDAVDKDSLNELLAKVWSKTPSQTNWPSSLNIELLQMTGIIVKNATAHIEAQQKSLVKYTWAHVQDDTLVSQTAYLTASIFFSQYEGPTNRFIDALWTGMLKPTQEIENSPIIRQALDVIAPVVPLRFGTARGPKWDVVTKRIIIEESNNQNHLFPIYRLILRHPDLFYPSRELFVDPILTSFTRMGFGGASTQETRTLMLDLADLIIRWEKSAETEVSNAMAVDSEETPSRWVMPPPMRESLLTCLTKLGVQSPDTFKEPGLTARPLRLLTSALEISLWSDVPIKLNLFVRAFELSETNETINYIICNAKTLNAISSQKPPSWFQTNASLLFTFSRKAMTSSNEQILETFTPVFQGLLDVIPIGPEGTELADFPMDVYQWLSECIREGLTTGIKIVSSLSLLHCLVKSQPSRVEPFASALMKVFAKFIKDHNTVKDPSGNSALSPKDAVAIPHRILLILEIGRRSVEFFGENRKGLLSGLVQLVSSSANVDVRSRILNISREWTLERMTQYPTIKEKASLFSKMQLWQKHSDKVYIDYLATIFDIYTSPPLARSDLTMRLETSFTLGCKVDNFDLRCKFLTLYNASITKLLAPRVAYLFGGQNWDSMSDANWAHIALDVILGAIDEQREITPQTRSQPDLPVKQFFTKDILQPLRHLLFFDAHAMHQTYISLFPQLWSGLSRKEQSDLTAGMVHVLSKDYYGKQDFVRPNVIETLLGGIQHCNPRMSIPPHLLKYLAKNFRGWYPAMEMLQDAIEMGRDDDNQTREVTYDALAETYAELCEDDYFYGLWRRRSLYEETNAALSYEQNGLWQIAQPLYEVAQIKTRQNIYPMSEAEYYVWEDHWLMCTEKLLQWDILGEIAAGEGNPDLILESAWRSLQTWSSETPAIANNINLVQDVPTPRRLLFKAYFTLNNLATAAKEQQAALAAQAMTQGIAPPPTAKLEIEPSSDFARIIEEAMQLSLRKWNALPSNISMAHVPIFTQFQQIVELKEASVLMVHLLATTRENINDKANEARNILHHWRDRLPTHYDDIGVWSDLIAWRQHVFATVNKFYLPLLTDAGPQSTANTHAHRGHHESAWIINRFAHVARKHGLLQVCHNSLNDIYKLPNIEISEAFLKLREQSRCHLERPKELYSGLDVINNTNLMYFSSAQKAEFYAMKGLFLHKLGRKVEANDAFAQALQMDIAMPKAWAFWARYSDDEFNLHPTDHSLAANAVSCYLHAASLFKSWKSRGILNRVLWLLGLDDANHTIGRMWDNHTGDYVHWYWITMVPQLLMALASREAKYAHGILFVLAKSFPQAVFFHLRTARDEFSVARKQQLFQQQQKLALQNATSQNANSHNVTGQTAAPQNATTVTAVATTGGSSEDIVMANSSENSQNQGSTAGVVPQSQNPEAASQAPRIQQMDPQRQQMEGPKTNWELVEELVSILKTGHPLLAMTLETFVDQIRDRLKALPEEELFRNAVTLLSEAITFLIQQTKEQKDESIPAQIRANALKLSQQLAIPEMKQSFLHQIDEQNAPTLRKYIDHMSKLRDWAEEQCERKPKLQTLDLWSHWLVEFHVATSEDINIPGQFLEHKDNKESLLLIKRMGTRLERCRMANGYFKRIHMLATNGSRHSFAIQIPGTRTSRREERMIQMVRVFNDTLHHQKEARRRNLDFHLLSPVALNPNIRLVRNDPSYVNLLDIHDEYLISRGIKREEPLLLYQQKLQQTVGSSKDLKVRTEILSEITAKLVPKTVLTNYMKAVMRDSASLWLMRKQFTYSIASTSFLTYILSLAFRFPIRYLVSRTTGLMNMGDIIPNIRGERPMLIQPETTPFRLTPNIQDFITPAGTEGLLTASMVAIGRGLCEPECEIQRQMWIFLRDEIIHCYRMQGRATNADKLELRAIIGEAVETIVRKITLVAGSKEKEAALETEGLPLPTTTLVAAAQSLINTATNPKAAAGLAEWSYAWF